MFSFGQPDRPQFGGVGMMVEPPAVEVTISPAARFAAKGQHADRVEKFAASIAANWRLPALPCCEISASGPPDHVGLGVGTQLGLSVAAGLRRFLALPELSEVQLAQSAGRGGRSAVGTYGFAQGGLLVDGGKQSATALGDVVRRVAVPADWCFLLVRCTNAGRGLTGDREAGAFAKLPAVPEETTNELWRIVNNEMLPALTCADCDTFGDAVYRYGRLAGECFAPVQGGPFASDQMAALVEDIRQHAVPGVGQSSWGPTLFAIAADDAAAHSLAVWLRTVTNADDCGIIISRPNNIGAQLSTLR
jgi:beta-RFAP synthase